MKAPIFVFTDDLDIFRSAQNAENYFEAWILEQGFVGFDSEGRTLAATTVLRPGPRILWLVPTQIETVSLSETTELAPEKLKQNLVSYLKQLEKNEEDWQALRVRPLSEVVERAIQLKGYSD